MQRQSTFIPINQKLIETSNPEKRIKARSRSYRTLSVEQRIGEPMADNAFKSARVREGKTEIVYDYDDYNSQRLEQLKKQIDNYYGAHTATTMARTRSATYVGSVSTNTINRAERAETKMIKI